ncbi:ABC transporter permease [Lutispora sp.]|uniref:ABC transporter permease n=1 Tax=Lutispora sp. TaxID=2828727 RepID=UPI002B1F0DFE|nr:ABC transporter permease subunit [Lutispora sp.]MEA4962321.1 ABC transporter permease subunit [Lutispora sp.]
MKNKAIWFMMILITWQLIYYTGVFDPLIFPSLGQILQALKESVTSGNIISELIYSIELISLGMILGIAFSAVLVILSLKSAIFESFVDAMISIIHPLPGIALLPLVILWFGTGSKSVIFIIFHSVLWPLLLNLKTGIKSIPGIYGETAQLIGVAGIDKFKDIYIPASMPYIIAGLKISWARAWRALISAEMIFGAAGGKGGIGWYIFKQRVFMDTPGMFAGLIVIIVTGVIVEELLFTVLEKQTIRKWGMSK